MLAIRRYCILRDSEELKEAIKMKMKQKDISLYSICKDLELDYSSTRRWLNGPSHDLRQYDVICIGRKVGIEIALKITIKD
jgi:hypothetical protein